MDNLHILSSTTIQSTPRNAVQTTHQLAPTKLMSRLVEDEGCHQEETTQDAMIDYDVQEPEDDDMSKMYKSKTALQISKAIGPQQILKVYDTFQTELKLKISEKKIKPSHTEKARYESLLSQIHTKVSSLKYELNRDIKRFETEHYQTVAGKLIGT